MPDRNELIASLKGRICGGEIHKGGYIHVPQEEAEATLELLKAQEPRLVVKEDFENADKYGYLPVYVENRDGDMYWDCITDAALGDTVSRFWTTKPTDEQRKAVKWND